MSDNPFGITRDEILQLAAKKIIDAHDLSPADMIQEQVQSMVEAQVEPVLRNEIERAMRAEIEHILSAKITPVDMWGEKAGPETTIREQLARKARQFWDEKVDKDGKVSSWGGEPRHTHIVRQVLKEEFDQAVKTNAAVVVKEFAAALKVRGSELVAEHISKLVNVR